MKTASILKNIEYDSDRPSISVLMESDFTKEIRIVFKKGQHMKEHTAPFPIIVQVFDGDIDFGVEGRIIPLGKGDLISLQGKIPHDLTANADSIVRLTLFKRDQVSRVQETLK